MGFDQSGDWTAVLITFPLGAPIDKLSLTECATVPS